jgi:crotonobetainyl-CoA:carnitine CoA-transferase CaiB-like acyl-CoA transferase
VSAPISGEGPLAGLRVVELAGLAPSPFGCMVLADLGADVLRVDRPVSRRGQGRVEGPSGGPLQRSRRAVRLDLTDGADRAALLRLVCVADVLVEGFRPGVTERLGIGPEVCLEANPRLVYARLTGWGQDGPMAADAGHDIDYIAIAGALQPIGPADEPPVPPLNMLADFAGGGMLLVIGVLAALHERERSGLGQVVDAAMLDGAALLTAFVHGMRDEGLWPAPRGHNLLDGGAPFYATYTAADGGYVAIGALEPAFYAALLDGLGLAGEDLPAQYDVSGWPALRARFAEVLAAKPRDDWAAVFAGRDACVVPVLAPDEAPFHPHNAARGVFVDVGGSVQPAPAPRFGRTPAGPPAPAPSESDDLAAALAAWDA